MQLPLGPSGDRSAHAYQAAQRTTRQRERLLDDLAALRVPDVVVAERGATYLVLAPPRRHGYGAGLATFLCVALVLADLVLVASSVLWMLLLPAALLPYLPLLLGEQRMLAVGAVDADDEPGVSRVTVHGTVWGELGNALDAYLDNLPAAPDGAKPEAGRSRTTLPPPAPALVGDNADG